MTTLRLELDSGNVVSFVVLSSRKISSYKQQSRLEVVVLRNSWFDVVDNIDKLNDEYYLEDGGTDIFGGRLVNSTNRDDSVLLEIGSWEEDALNAQPTNPTEEFVAVSDNTIIQDAISRVPGLSVGNVQTIANDISILFSNTSPAGMIREVQRTTGGFVQYNADKTVDYLEKPRSNPNVATIGPQYSNVQDKFDVLEDEREEFTHIRVLGAQEGQARIQAEAVSNDYSGGVESWRVYPDKNITTEDRAQKIANNIMDEVESDSRRIRINTTVFNEDLDVGDRVRADSEVDNLDREFWVTNTEKTLEAGTDTINVELSNRLILDEGEGEKRRRDVQRFNTGFQGDVVTLNAGGYRAPIDNGVPYEFQIRKPSDVVGELDAELQVNSLPYRTYVSSQGHTHDFTVPDHTHDFTINDHTHSVDIPSHSHGFSVPDHTHSFSVPDHTHSVSFSSTTTSDTVPSDQVESYYYNRLEGEVIDSDINQVIDSHTLGSNETGWPYYFSFHMTFNTSASAQPKIDELYVRINANGLNYNMGWAFQDDPINNRNFLPLHDFNMTSDSLEGENVELLVTLNTDDGTAGFFNIDWSITAIPEHAHDVTLSDTVTSGNGGAVSDTTGNGGFTSDTTDSGGSSTETTSNGGGVNTSTNDGGFTSDTTSSEAGFVNGVNEFSQQTPSNVGVEVNGSVVDSNVGSGVFTEVVDIGGQLTEGFNTVKITSDDLGHMQATGFLDVYRQITQ